ncbi:MAG: hypothetical protein ACRYHQ_28380 [Janthinobacterium lividum]
MDSAQSMARLRGLAAALQRIPAAAWFAEVLARYEAGAEDGLTLDRAFGLAPPAGGEPWWDAERRTRRDAAIRALHEQCFADLGVTKAAQQIASRGRRLQATAWQREQRQAVAGDELLIAALATGAPFPGARRIRDIIRSGNER